MLIQTYFVLPILFMNAFNNVLISLVLEWWPRTVKMLGKVEAMHSCICSSPLEDSVSRQGRRLTR